MGQTDFANWQLATGHSPSRAIVGIGSNLEDPAAQIDRAVHALSVHADFRVLGVSRLVRSRAAGGPQNQPDFCNAATLLETRLEPPALVQSLLAIEAAMGRTRQGRWEPRIVDLDLLCHGDTVLTADPVVVPHPWLCIRPFALLPAADVASEWIHPILRRPLRQLAEQLIDRSGHVVILTTRPEDRDWLQDAARTSMTGTSFQVCQVDARDGLFPPSLLEFPGSTGVYREIGTRGPENTSALNVRAYLVLDTAERASDRHNRRSLSVLPNWLGCLWDEYPAPAAWLNVADREAAEGMLRHAFQAMTRSE